MTEPGDRHLYGATDVFDDETVDFPARGWAGNGVSSPTPVDRDSCPVKTPGQLARIYYFLSRVGELRSLRVADLTRRRMISLFVGELDWGITHFPAYDNGLSPPVAEALVSANCMARAHPGWAA